MKRQIIPFLHHSVIDKEFLNIALSGYSGSFDIEKSVAEDNSFKTRFVSSNYPDKNEIKEYKDTLVFIEGLIYKALNRCHKECKSDRYWKIIMGHWIKRVSDMTIYKYKILTDSVAYYNPSQITLLDFDYSEFSCFGSEEWLYKSESLVWDSNIYNIIYKNSDLLKNTKLVLSSIPSEIKDEKLSISKKHERFRNVKKIIRFVLYKLLPNSTPVIYSTYFTFSQEIRLCFSLNTLPKIFSFSYSSASSSNYDYQRRKKIAALIKSSLECELHKIIVDTIILTMPKCFLEDYYLLKDSACKQYAPRTPKFILTANAYDTHEIFKYWTALKVEEGTQYFVVQHGNNSGTHSFLSPSNEEETADKFFTWGWMIKDKKKYIPMCIVSRLKSRSSDTHKGFILVLQEPRLKLSLPLNSYDRWVSSYNSQSRFLSGINHTVNLILKGKKSSDINSIQRLKARFPWIQCASSDMKLSDLIHQSKLIVHMYDSTGLYECLSINKPTLAFFCDGFQGLRSECYDAFAKLHEMRIVFFDIDLLVEHINSVENNISEWWNSSCLQEARRLFCMDYARSSRDSVSELTRLIR